MSVILAPNGRPARMEAKARYEGAQHTRNRSWISWGVGTADSDMRGAGQTLTEKARYLWKNSPFIRGMVERIVTLWIGTGINPVPASSDPKWNVRAKKHWREEVSKHVELATGAHWGSACQIIGRAQLVDGEIFANLVDNDGFGKGRVQLIEAHHLPFGENKDSGTIDGMKLDDAKRVTSYVFKGWKEKDYPVAKDKVVHFIRRMRACQHRGETLLAAAINYAHDVDDILALEKAAVKGHSAIKDIIETASGEVSEEDLVVNGDKQVDPVAELRFYRQMFGTETRVMKRGDKYSPFISNRPSPAWQGFMDFLTNTVVISSNFPPSVVLGSKDTSSSNRRDLQMAARVVEQMQSDLTPRLHRLYVHLMTQSVEDGPLVGAPNDWRSVSWQGPRSATIDAGREAAQDREDYLVGLENKRRLFGVWGEDWEEEEAQTEIEVRSLVKRAQAIAKDLDVDFNVALNLLSRRDPNAMSAMKPAEAPKDVQL